MSNEPHVTALELDLLALGQAPPQSRARIEAHSAACAACAARRAQHDADVQHFRTSVFPRTAERVVAPRPSGWRWRWLLGLAVPVAACVLLLARGRVPPSGPADDQSSGLGTLGIKGPSARVFARRSRPPTTDVVSVSDGDRLSAGDALRFVLLPTGRPYVLIASVDGAGQANIYYPFHGEASGEVDPKATVSVPGSIVLDQAPGPERLFFIHSAAPLRADLVRAALVKLGKGGATMIRGTQRLPLAGTLQSTLLFEKEERP
jgi:hypothetical protein